MKLVAEELQSNSPGKVWTRNEDGGVAHILMLGLPNLVTCSSVRTEWFICSWYLALLFVLNVI